MRKNRPREHGRWITTIGEEKPVGYLELLLLLMRMMVLMLADACWRKDDDADDDNNR